MRRNLFRVEKRGSKSLKESVKGTLLLYTHQRQKDSRKRDTEDDRLQGGKRVTGWT